jgi:hypothetical protein
MASDTRSRIASLARAAAPIALLLAAIATLLRFPPESYHFYPRCPIFTLFHIQCPGCGSTRALAALLQGHLIEALRLNALTTLAIRVFFVWAALNYRLFLKHKPLYGPQTSNGAISAMLPIATLFSIPRIL